MSLRAALLLLLFANLAFFGWAHLVDVTPEPPPDDSIAHLPKLELLSEVKKPSTAASHASSPASAAPRPAAGANSSGPASSPASSAEPRPGAAAAPPLARSGAAAQSAQRCVTVGPFNDAERVGQAADMLQQRGFEVRQRSEQSPQTGYWVYVGGLKSESDEKAVVSRLVQHGVSDAHVMPDSDKGGRVSVGFFSERDGAERRARAVRGLGMNADIEKRTQSAAAHWVDVDIDSSTQSLPTEELLSLQDVGSRLEVKECSSATYAKMSPSPP